MTGLLRIEDGSGLVPALLALQLQTFVPFATAAQRATQWPNRPVGAVSVRLDGGPAFEWWNGTAWVPL